MEPTIELRVAEFLASRLCHDLVSPIGAVNSGIELLTEFGDDPDGERRAGFDLRDAEIAQQMVLAEAELREAYRETKRFELAEAAHEARGGADGEESVADCRHSGTDRCWWTHGLAFWWANSVPKPVNR
jgi:histidine phosphotransferase ChpT